MRFHLRAKVAMHLAAGTAANRVRGGLGRILKSGCPPDCRDSASCPIGRDCLYGRLFDPAPLTDGPSGLRNSPRPFVLRPRGLEERRVRPGELLALDVHLFDVSPTRPEQLTMALAAWALDGFGPEPGTAELARAEQLRLDGSLERVVFDGATLQASAPALSAGLEWDRGVPVGEVTVAFLSPTELKGEEPGQEIPSFRVLVSRAVERVATLARLYNGQVLAVDFQGLVARAEGVAIGEGVMRTVDRGRVSARTGQRHGLGGMVGSVRYQAGDLREFLPWLEAARWTGVGRQTVWGKGELGVEWKG
jgi:hypothetical protein